VKVTGPHASVALIDTLRSGIGALQLAPALTVRFDAQVTMVGGVVSITVTVAVQVVVLFAASRAVRVIV
jgi:hypothetical protein